MFKHFLISRKKRGFTLLELLVAVGLFTILASISMGAVINIFDANNRAESSKTVIDNLNLALENMTRTVRFGSVYHCGTLGTLTNPQDCLSGNDSFLAIQFEGNTVIYRLNGTAIQKSTNGGSTYTDITSPETKVQNLRSYVHGS